VNEAGTAARVACALVPTRGVAVEAEYGAGELRARAEALGALLRRAYARAAAQDHADG